MRRHFVIFSPYVFFEGQTIITFIKNKIKLVSFISDDEDDAITTSDKREILLYDLGVYLYLVYLSILNVPKN